MFSKSETFRLKVQDPKSKIPRLAKNEDIQSTATNDNIFTLKTPSKPSKKVIFSSSTAKKPLNLGTPLRVLSKSNFEAQTPLARSKALGTPLRVKKI
jgi:hypothetical protein